MNKKYILLTISSILLVGLVAIIINRNSKEYIMQDGVMLALTLDGEKIDSYPNETNYHVEVNCKNGKGKWLVDEWKLAVEEVTGNVLCNIDFASNPTLLKTEVEKKATTNANGYRYIGKEPDNWIWFNNEKWRIIGSVPVTLSNGTENDMIKLIRSEPIGSLAFNLEASNTTWGQNSLYNLLNNYYYGKKNGTGINYCSGYSTVAYALCNYENIGISNLSDDYYGRMLEEVYWNVGVVGNTYSISTIYTLESRTKSSLVATIGLMNMSDYGYATSGISHDDVKSDALNNNEQNNWLYNLDEWTMTPSSSSNLFAVLNSGALTQEYQQAYQSHAVRPVVYLDPSVYVVSGDGTEGNPYQIGM